MHFKQLAFYFTVSSSYLGNTVIIMYRIFLWPWMFQEKNNFHSGLFSFGFLYSIYAVQIYNRKRKFSAF